jgi:hypothetical protein
MPLAVTVISMTATDMDAAFAGDDLVLRLAASSAYLTRLTGSSRAHTESDLRLWRPAFLAVGPKDADWPNEVLFLVKAAPAERRRKVAGT